MGLIRSVEVIEYVYEIKGGSTYYNAHRGTENACYKKGATRPARKFVIVIESDDGFRGEYAPHNGASRTALSQVLELAPALLGKNPEEREKIQIHCKTILRHFDQTGLGLLDIALWDLAGKKYSASISSLLGGFRKELPVYGCTCQGQPSGGGLDSLQAYADFAMHCKSLGISGFKVHGWRDGDPKREAAILYAIRNAVGDDMHLMTDPSCALSTYLDALYLGRACDEVNCLWYEDPYQDSATSAFGYKRLREKIRTPLLLGEHVRNTQQKADFLLAGGTDILHIDPELDGGISNTIRLAHFADVLGVDVSLHTSSPTHRHLMSAIRNCSMYELGPLCWDERPNLAEPPIYACGYSDSLGSVNERGAVTVPDGPGLGVVYDWDKIKSMEVARHTFKK